jgi:hypothetical protein
MVNKNSGMEQKNTFYHQSVLLLVGFSAEASL